MSESLQMPSFKYAAPINVDLDVLDKEDAGSKFLKPGQYAATIAKVEYLGQAPKDQRWAKMSVTFGTADDKAIRRLYIVPTPAVEDMNHYGDSVNKDGTTGTSFPARNIRKLLTAAGLPTSTPAELTRSLTAAFDSLSASKLLGKTVNITVAYTRPYIDFSKEANGFMLLNPDGTPHMAFSGHIWSERDSAQQEVAERQITVQGFPDVTEVVSGNSAKTASPKAPF